MIGFYVDYQNVQVEFGFEFFFRLLPNPLPPRTHPSRLPSPIRLFLRLLLPGIYQRPANIIVIVIIIIIIGILIIMFIIASWIFACYWPYFNVLANRDLS